MSLLYRTGAGRNSIAWGGGTTTSAYYLRRTGTSRNDISFINISSNGTYNILERYSTSRNDIRWNNIVFSFFTDLTGAPSMLNGINDGEIYNFGTFIIYGNNGVFDSTKSGQMIFSDTTNLRVSGNRYDFRPNNRMFAIQNVYQYGVSYESFGVAFRTATDTNSYASYIKNYSNIYIHDSNHDRSASIGTSTIINYTYNNINYYITVFRLNGSSYRYFIRNVLYVDFS